MRAVVDAARAYDTEKGREALEGVEGELVAVLAGVYRANTSRGATSAQSLREAFAGVGVMLTTAEVEAFAIPPRDVSRCGGPVEAAKHVLASRVSRLAARSRGQAAPEVSNGVSPRTLHERYKARDTRTTAEKVEEWTDEDRRSARYALDVLLGDRIRDGDGHDTLRDLLDDNI